MPTLRFRCFSFITISILVIGLLACNKAQDQSAQNSPDQTGNVTAAGDPANGNLAAASTDQYAAPVQQTPPVAASGESYAPPPAADYGSDYAQDASYQQPVQASQPPPPLPDYDQPPAPGDDYVWTPGYWNYANDGYYWVPGVWVLAPYVGALWTPPWWGYDNGVYLWHTGYWGPHIGYYGGIDYGFGYTGRGYYGAYWDHGHLDYNRSVTNVNTTIVHNVYNYSVPSRGSRVSYNGGRGGIEARPTAQELAVVHDPRTPPVAAQIQHARQASTDRAQFAAGGRAQPSALVAPQPLATSYKAPAARPPAAAMRAAAAAVPAPRPEEARPTPQTRAQQEATPSAAERQARPQEARPQEAHPQEARPQAARPQEARPAPPAHLAPQARPEPIPTAPPRPAPVVRPEARPGPAQHPETQARPEARRAASPRAEPQARPEPRSEARPAPAPRPAPKPKEEEHKEH